MWMQIANNNSFFRGLFRLQAFIYTKNNDHISKRSMIKHFVYQQVYLNASKHGVFTTSPLQLNAHYLSDLFSKNLQKQLEHILLPCLHCVYVKL